MTNVVFKKAHFLIFLQKIPNYMNTDPKTSNDISYDDFKSQILEDYRRRKESLLLMQDIDKRTGYVKSDRRRGSADSGKGKVC